MQEHMKEANAMFADERRKVNERYKEYYGVYLGRYAQDSSVSYLSLASSAFVGFIAVLTARHYEK